MRGWVYIMTTAGMPGLVKVGYSSHPPEKRAVELFGTSTPYPLCVACAIFVDDAYDVEQAAHSHLGYCRVNENREWFKCPVEHAYRAITNVIAENRLQIYLHEYSQQAANEPVPDFEELKARSLWYGVVYDLVKLGRSTKSPIAAVRDLQFESDDIRAVVQKAIAAANEFVSTERRLWERYHERQTELAREIAEAKTEKEKADLRYSKQNSESAYQVHKRSAREELDRSIADISRYLTDSTARQLERYGMVKFCKPPTSS